MLKLKLQYFGHLMQRADSLEKTLMLGKIEGRRKRGWQDEMFGWHHQFSGHELGKTQGDGKWACWGLFPPHDGAVWEGKMEMGPMWRTDWWRLLLFHHCCVWLFVTPWAAACQASLSFTISWSLLKLMSIEPLMPSKHLILCHPLLLPSIFPSIRVFSIESALHIRWPKYWSFSFSISLSSEYSGLISFRTD